MTPVIAAATRAALLVLRQGPRDLTMLKRLVHGSHDQSQMMSERLQATQNPHRLRLAVCSEGCAWCCYQGVLVSVPEALLLAEYLRATRPEPELAALVARAADRNERGRDMDHVQRFRARLPCPLLDEASGACTVHEVRPGSCRAYVSSDVSACRKAFDDRDADLPIPTDGVHQRAVNSVWHGVIAACIGEGLEPGPVELSAALAVALREPRALERWFAGERLFEQARTRIARDAEPITHRNAQAGLQMARTLDGGSAPAPPRVADDSEAARRARNKRKRERKR